MALQGAMRLYSANTEDTAAQLKFREEPMVRSGRNVGANG